MTEGSEREDEMVDRKHSGPPKVGDKSPKVGGPFDKGHCKFCLFVKFQKPPKVGGLKMSEGSKREDEMVDRKHGGPPKVGDKSPKVGGPFEIGHYRF